MKGLKRNLRFASSLTALVTILAMFLGCAKERIIVQHDHGNCTCNETPTGTTGTPDSANLNPAGKEPVYSCNVVVFRHMCFEFPQSRLQGNAVEQLKSFCSGNNGSFDSNPCPAKESTGVCDISPSNPKEPPRQIVLYTPFDSESGATFCQNQDGKLLPARASD